MNKRELSRIMLAFLLVSILTLTLNIRLVKSEPVERKVGVKVGDWAKYGDVTIILTSNDPSPPVELDPRVFEIEWLLHVVQTIVGTDITFQAVLHFTDGSEETQTLSIDVNNGNGLGRLYFISADLDAGDTIYSPPYEAVINETISQVYADAVRETNHVNMSTIMSYGEYALFSSFDGYWDRMAGVLCEYEMLQTYTHQIEGYVTSLTVTLKLTETNIWSPLPETIGELKTKIEELGSEDEIDNQGIITSLLAKLDAAQKLIDNGKIDQAKNMLEAFINEVQAQSGKHIAPEAADTLTESAEYLIFNL